LTERFRKIFILILRRVLMDLESVNEELDFCELNSLDAQRVGRESFRVLVVDNPTARTHLGRFVSFDDSKKGVGGLLELSDVRTISRAMGVRGQGLTRRQLEELSQASIIQPSLTYPVNYDGRGSYEVFRVVE
jgi:hypothetical protein